MSSFYHNEIKKYKEPNKMFEVHFLIVYTNRGCQIEDFLYEEN